MKSPKKKFEPQTIGEVLDDIVGSKALKTGLNNAKVVQLWSKLMGENIERYTDKIIVKNKTNEHEKNKSNSKTQQDEGLYRPQHTMEIASSPLENGGGSRLCWTSTCSAGETIKWLFKSSVDRVQHF